MRARHFSNMKNLRMMIEKYVQISFSCKYSHTNSLWNFQKKMIQIQGTGQSGRSSQISQSLLACLVSHMPFIGEAILTTIVLSPLASSMFTPGIEKIAKSLNATTSGVIGCQTGFVVMLGIGPLILAPLSETFGRKPLYLICFTVFTLLQIPTALAPNLPMLITMRTIAGFFGSMSLQH